MRKKFLLMIFVLSLFTSMGGGWLHAQTKDGVSNTSAETVILFEECSNFGDWGLIDGDGDGLNWYCDDECLISKSYQDKVLRPENYIYAKDSYLISESSVLTWDACPSHSNYVFDSYSVVISTNETDWVKVFTENFNEYSSTILASKECKLDKYAGQEVYIGFLCDGFDRDGNCDGVKIDNIKLTGAAPVAEPVAKIGETPYNSFADALNAAKSMTGDVTVEIYEKVTMNQALAGSYNSIKFVGKDTDAEIYLDVQGYTTATGKKVSFTDLKLSKSVGGFITNAGFMNVAFGIFDVAEVSYTNCTFLNGAYASSGKVTFNGCTFYRSHDKYGLWAYGNVDITVDGSTFADYRGIKMYAENGADASVEKANLTVKNTNFSAVNNKPAIVLTYGESVVLEGNTYSSTGTFELDLDGKPNGVAVTSDVAPTCINDNGACGVLVDGKIYTTVAQAAEVATSGSTVTLLHNSTETVEFPIGVTLEKNGFEAIGVTVVVPVAQIGEVKYETFQAALKAIGSGDVVINLLKDVTMDITAWQTLAIGAENTTSITIDGENGDNDFTLTFNKLNSDWNHIATSNDNATKLILKNLKLADSGKNNGPWNRYDHNFACDVELTNVVSNKALAFKAGATLYNVTINETGDNYAIWIQPNGQDVNINGLTVVSAGRGIKIDNQYVGDAQLVNLSVKNAQFETVKKAAIVVKSPAGANIVAENVDITKVAADSRNLVWVDEDGATDFGKVTLTGGTVAQEGLEGFVAAISANDKVQAYYTSLQAAIDAVQNGETIVLTKDCAEVVSINKSNVAFTINGKISDTENIAYTGKIQINVGQNVTVKNINFSHAGDEAHDFIANVGSPTGKNYNTTLLVEGCSFVGGNNNYNTVAVRTIHPTHTQIKNSTGTGLHSFLQNTGGQQVTVEGVVLTDSKGGLAIGSPNDAVSVKGCDLTTNTYGVRLDANNTNAPGTTLENNKVNAYIPVSVRKATAPNYNLTFNGEENAYVATNGDNVWCAVCTTEYEEGVALNAPTGKVRVALNDTGLSMDGVYGAYVPVAKIGETEYTSLEEAFKVATSGCTIDILSDVTVDYNWDARYTGGKFSVPVTINGNDKTIKFTASVNDNNYQAPFRFEADATVKGLTIDMSETTDSRFRAISSKGNLTVDGCTFIGKDETLNCRAIIFGEGAGANVGNLAISVTNSKFINWKRGITDNENGQDVKTATITGNTLENAAVYVSAYENVTFTGNTVEGAYVDIRSYTANSSLNVTATGNTLEENTDTAYNYIKATGNIDQEGFKVYAVAKIGDVEYTTIEKAYAALQEGDEIVILKKGSYALKVKNNITITGAVAGVEFANIGAFGCNGANVTFNNVTFTYAENSTYKGLQHSGNLVYNNCTFNGQVFLYGASETFNNCTFNTTDSNNYNVWTYGAKEVAFNECTFNCAGKSVLIYNESASVNNNVAVTKSQFIASKSVEGKAAIEMDSSLQGTINLTIEETTATGFAAGNVSGNSLWNNKKANNDITVVVDNETVLAPINGDGTEDNPYLINNVRELVAFRKSVNAGKTEFNAPGVYVALNADIDLAGTTWEHGIGDGINATFDGIFDGRNNTIKNFTMEVSAPAGDYVCGGLFGYINGAATIKNLVIENATITATVNGEGQGHNVGVLVGFANNNGGKATIDNVTVKGDVKVDAPNVYGVGTIVGYTYRDMGTISNCTVDADADAGSYIKGYSFVGGITGYSFSNAVISNCSVENLAITATSKGVGGIAGLALNGNNISGCTVANTTTVNGETNVAYIIGELGNSNGNVIIENCTAPQPWVGGAYATGEPFVATIGTKYYTSIKDAIKAVKDNETIVLIRDITMDYNARDSYETQTQNIVIDGNDHTLTLNQKNSDWASIGLANNSKLVLNNMTIEKTGYGDTNGAWNTHAIIFSCPLEMNDVIVNNAIAVQAGATLNDVTINEANGYYGLWINGNGQSVTMNGGSITATNGGRGIKIADQYIDAPAQVTLNVTGTVFNTAKKAAVLVSSKEGAQIVASNVDITDVVADDDNFVWVDEDWAANFGNVEVTGAKVAQEGIENFVAEVKKDAKVEGYYASLQAAINAVQNGETIGGTVTLIKDVAENVTVSQAPNVAITIDGNNKTFKGTITVDGKSAAYATAGLTIKNVNFDATNISKDACINLGGNNSIRYTSNVTVEYCTFTGTDKAKVGVKNYTGGCKNVTIKNCTATGLHSLAQLKTSTTVTLAENTVTESKNGVSLGSSTGVTVTECTFTVDGYGIRPDGGASVTITDSNISAFIPVVVRNASADASLTFNGTNDMTETNTDGYWCVIGATEYEANGELPTAATGNVIVNLNDEGLSYEGVYGNYAVAKIDKVQYASLQAAIEDAQNGETVILFANTDEVVSVNVLNKEISIVGEEDLFPVLTGGLDFGIDNHSQDAGNITIKGIKFVGNGIKIDDMASVTIEGNIFEDITASNAIYVAADEYTTTLAITNNIITKVAGAGINLRNPINATITGNAITNVTGNAMTFQNDGAIEDVAGEIVITGNVLTDWANGKTEGRAIRLALGNIADNVIIEENAMIAANAPEEFVKISGTSNAEISVDENYWNGVAPTAQHFLADGVQIHNYYASYNVETNTLSNLVTLAGEILEKFYTAAGVETTKEQAAYSLSFAITDYDNKEASVKIGSKAPSSGVKLVTPTEVQINGETYSVTSLAKNAFSGTNFASIEISEGVTIIGDYALANMYKLTDVIFPSTLKTVGYRCFYGYGPTANSLETITSYATEVPAAEAASFQTAVGENATLYVYGNYNDYKKAEGWKKFTNIIGKVIVEKEGYSLLVKVSDNNCSVQINDRPAQAAKLQLEIPAEIDYFGTTREITSIANNGFKSCSFYGTITVPGTVKTVGNSAFNTCTQVSKVVFEEGVETIGTRALATMGNLTTVVFPSTLKTLADECFYGYHAENHKVTTIVSYATEAPTAVAGTFQQGICNKATLYVFEDAIASYKAAAGWKKFVNVKAIEAQIGETYYLTLASAIKAAQASDVIELIANVEAADATPIVIPTDVTLNINTHNIKANIYGTVKTEGGVWTTVAVPGFASRAMLGDDAIYSTTDATVANLENEIEVVAGTIVLNPNPEKEWWTLPGQSLSIAEDATFKVPANVKFTVRENTHVVADGTIVTEGVVYLQAGATVEAAEGLNIQTEVEDHVVEYTDGIYSVVRAIFTQTIQLNAGWNWFSSYVETDLESLQAALGTSGVQIVGKNGYVEYYGEYGWLGDDISLLPSQMYMIQTSSSVELKLSGKLLEKVEITLKKGWNWISFPMNTSSTLVNYALSKLSANNDDVIEGKSGYATYYEGYGWIGTLETLEPGQGYMYYSNNETSVTFTYSPSSSKSEAKANITTDGNYWIPNAAQFANNMIMTAVLDVENINYEVAAFVNGECRGSARPIYVEALDAYMLFLTIHGEEVEEMTFKYYDIDTDTEYTLSDRINYSNGAILGSLKEPYMFTRGTTGIGEAELSQLNIYPNPTTTAAEINLNATFDKVEVFNALGVKVAEYSNVDSIDALETAGIYVIRATNNSVISHCRLVVK